MLKQIYSQPPESVFKLLRVLIVLNPLVFSLVVYITDFVNFKQAFGDSGVYIGIAKSWLNNNSQLVTPERLPVYPIFIFLIFKLFGIDNLNALLFAQGLIGSFTVYLLLKILDLIKISRNIFVLLTVFFNLSLIFWFSVFLPNCFFIFLLTIFIFCFTKFYVDKNRRYFFLMCFFLILLLLTRPIFTLSIFFVLPIISIIVFKSQFKNSFKVLMITCLFASYFSGITLQSLRYYSHNKSFNYTTQTGEHFLYYVIPCLAQKYGCGKTNLKTLNILKDNYKEYRKNNPYVSINEDDKIKIQLGIDYLLGNNISISEIAISSIFSYLKTMFHSSTIQIYESFKIMPSKIKNSSFTDPTERLIFLINNLFVDYKITFWFVALLFVFITRTIEFIGILYILSAGPHRLYICTIFTTFLTLIIPTLGMGNPRYRSESEILLIILGAFGFYAINKFLKKNKLIM